MAKTLKIEELSPKAFAPFGRYVNMTDIEPGTEYIGEKPIQFFRDMQRLPINHPQSLPSFSICRVEKRPLVVDVTEYHSYCAEGNLPLDADCLIHVAPASPNGVCPMNDFRIFRVPKGTFITINAGVWHHAPFVHDKKASSLNMLIVLPERVYANDCVVVEFAKADHMTIAE